MPTQSNLATDFDPDVIQKSDPIYQQVYRQLRGAIISGQLLPKTRLVETRLADELGVSRTPVREAIRLLERQGLVVPVDGGGGGVEVYEPSREDIKELYGCRAALEGYLVLELARHADRIRWAELQQGLEQALDPNADQEYLIRNSLTFHDVLIGICPNSKLQELASNVRAQVMPYLLTNLLSHDRARQVPKEHLEILQVTRAGKDRQAERLMQKHLLRDRDNLLRVVHE
ncbi:MAG: GntR family transcriptional regulator [Anaerolineae bacterium]